MTIIPPFVSKMLISAMLASGVCFSCQIPAVSAAPSPMTIHSDGIVEAAGNCGSSAVDTSVSASTVNGHVCQAQHIDHAQSDDKAIPLVVAQPMLLPRADDFPVSIFSPKIRFADPPGIWRPLSFVGKIVKNE